MQKLVIAVKDTKIGSFEAVHQVKHVGEAIRGWDTVRSEGDTKYAKYPQDFELYQIATFDEETGLMTPLTPYLHLASGV